MSDINPDDLHFVMSHPESVARQMTKDREKIERLSAENRRLKARELAIATEFAKMSQRLSGTYRTNFETAIHLAIQAAESVSTQQERK